MREDLTLRRFADLAAVSVLAVAIAAVCGDCGGETPAPVTDVYSVRGIVETLPQTAGGDRSLSIHHVAIPAYRGASGKVVGMMPVTMPFPLAAGVSLSAIAPGVQVESTFTVPWKPLTAYEMTEIHALPAGTVVNFEPPH